MKRYYVHLCCALWLAACDDEPSDGASDVAADAVPDVADDSDAPADDTSADGDATPDLPAGPTVTVPVADAFAAGTAVRDAYGGATATVAEDGTVTLATHPNGVLLLERDAQPGAEAAFSWDNATVYFAITDRFENGNPANDGSYGREPDGLDEIGTWHGGDFAGLTDRLDYLAALGVNALWISAPYEQVHGWVGGGTGDFPHYGYHGYWALDYTRLDANFGTEQEFRALIDEAHARGIRIVLDVVMNHPGYATMADLAEYLPEVLSGDWQDWTPGEGQNWHSWNDLFVDYRSNAWADWWGPKWIRAGFPQHCSPGDDDLTGSQAFLPDFITTPTESCSAARGDIEVLPGLLQAKTDTEAVFVEGNTVRDYLVSWLTAWVREYGIDGFRCDTAKHVELEAWRDLNEAATAALAAWKDENPEDALDDLAFWSTAEVFPHGVVRDAYFDTALFDSVINFDFQSRARTVIADADALDALYAEYAEALNDDPTFDVLSYVSSHDTSLFFETTGGSIDDQYRVGTALLMLPGGVQIFYGDESARPAGPAGSDAQQGTRSDMNWDSADPELLAHWQRLGAFRNRHRAVGAGEHARIEIEGGYAFSRRLSEPEDAVVVVLLD